ncbi:hypothetical protein [Maridesulfovibrio frigidus]|uniref:hypothetical protein n=1 Tax=Maridesulfovibrio frigidus TaxID=340956 RepID=UPI0004E1DCEA|nr:hypothetical protein [Maridesulfovibrio frigidus]
MSKLGKTTKVVLGVPTAEHIELVASRARLCDREDMEGLRPHSSIMNVIMGDVKLSRLVYALYLDGVPHAVLGVIPGRIEGVGIPWLVGTSDVDENPLPFARISLSVLELMQSDFPTFETFVCARNRTSTLWHRWCGFKFEPEKIKLGRDYYYRAIRRLGTKIKKREGI